MARTKQLEKMTKELEECADDHTKLLRHHIERIFVLYSKEVFKITRKYRNALTKHEKSIDKVDGYNVKSEKSVTEEVL